MTALYLAAARRFRRCSRWPESSKGSLTDSDQPARHPTITNDHDTPRSGPGVSAVKARRPSLMRRPVPEHRLHGRQNRRYGIHVRSQVAHPHLAQIEHLPTTALRGKARR